MSKDNASIINEIIKKFQNGEINNSIFEIEKYLKLNLSDEIALYNYGYMLDQIGKFEKAIEQYKKVILINKNNWKAKFNLYVNYIRLKLYDNALELVNDVLEIKKNFQPALRDKALILVGFYSFCRRSELLGMQYEHLNFEDDGIQVLIPFSKTDQKGEGRMIYLPKINDPYCPVTALQNWLKVALINSGPLFYKINKANNIEKYVLNYKNQKISLTDTSFVLILKKRAREAGLDNCDKNCISNNFCK